MRDDINKDDEVLKEVEEELFKLYKKYQPNIIALETFRDKLQSKQRSV